MTRKELLLGAAEAALNSEAYHYLNSVGFRDVSDELGDECGWLEGMREVRCLYLCLLAEMA